VPDEHETQGRHARVSLLDQRVQLHRRDLGELVVGAFDRARASAAIRLVQDAGRPE
jgi:hypothetical protein